MEYHSKYTGAEVDALLDKVNNGGGNFDSQGVYPDLTAGDLAGRGESVPAQFGFRASGGKSIKDGTARIKRLKGNSVVWNQKVKGLASWNLQGGTIEGNEAVWSAESRTGVLNAYSNTFAQHTTHKYLITADVKASSSNVGLGIYYTGSPLVRHTGSGNYESLAIITNGTGDGIDVCYLTDTSTSGYGEIRAKNYRCIDLTQMFQAGNEPTTIEEYNARKPIVADEYAYNEGEVIHMTAEGIKSVGDNAWNGEWEQGDVSGSNGVEMDSTATWRNKGYIRIIPNEYYYIQSDSNSKSFLRARFYDADKNFIGIVSASNTDIYTNETFKTAANAHYMRFAPNTSVIAQGSQLCVSLVHSGWKADTDAKYQPYWEDRLMFDKRIKDEFPDGMSKYDMVYNKNGKGHIVHGLGVEDMGDLNWAYSNNAGWGTGFYADMIAQNNNSAPIILSDCYLGVSADSIYGANLNTDKIITIEDGRVIRVHDSAYTDAASFKEAMAGVSFYYQLAEPTIIEYDEPFNLNYRVADFGTEEIIASQPSAPLNADIIYQFNAVDMIREHELEITELQRIIATMQAQLTSLTSNNNN